MQIKILALHVRIKLSTTHTILSKYSQKLIYGKVYQIHNHFTATRDRTAMHKQMQSRLLSNQPLWIQKIKKIVSQDDSQ